MSYTLSYKSMTRVVVADNVFFQLFSLVHTLSHHMGHDSSVGIASRYGLDGPRIESRLGRDFPHPSRPVLGPTQPPAQ